MTFSRLSRLSISISAPTRLMWLGMMSSPVMSVVYMASRTSAWSMMHSYMEQSTSLMSTPSPLEALACGSASTTSTVFSSVASEAARLMVVVVLPTPPFWLAKAMIFPMSQSFRLLYVKMPWRAAASTMSCHISVYTAATTPPRNYKILWQRYIFYARNI